MVRRGRARRNDRCSSERGELSLAVGAGGRFRVFDVHVSVATARQVGAFPRAQRPLVMRDFGVAPFDPATQQQQLLLVREGSHVHLVAERQTGCVHLFGFDAQTSVAIAPVFDLRLRFGQRSAGSRGVRMAVSTVRGCSSAPAFVGSRCCQPIQIGRV